MKRNFMENLLDGVEVEWVPLNKVVKTVTAPTKVKKEIYREKGKIPIIDQGITFIAGYTDEDVETKFRSLYTAFQYGAPPHAGMAPGIDRILMLLKDEENIREMVAFPMAANGADALMGSPNEVFENQLSEDEIFVNQLLKQISSENDLEKFGQVKFKTTFDIPIKFNFDYDLTKLKNLIKIMNIDKMKLDLIIVQSSLISIKS